MSAAEEQTRPVALVAGAGPGVSGSLARRYAADGWDVALLGSDETAVRELAESLASYDVGVRHTVADLRDEAAARAAVTRFGGHAGHLDVVHFNPSAFRHLDPLALSVGDLLDDVALGVGALLSVVQAARPFMVAGGRITVTGSMAADEPWHEAASLGVQKAGVRNLVHSLDATLAPDGIRAVSVTVRGTLSDDGPFTPDRVAAALVDAARQDEAGWRSEIAYAG